MSILISIVDNDMYIVPEINLSMQELKGNIRVFCRVRPFLSDDGVGADTKVISFPTATETMGRGIDVTQNGELTCWI